MTTTIKILSFITLLITGFIAYVMLRGQGDEIALEDDQFSSGNAVITALNPLTRNSMAAMRILDRPIDLNGLSFGNGGEQSFTIADWKGRVILLNIWATWCPPCREEMPLLDDLQAQLGSEEFEVVAVSIDMGGMDKPKKFFRDTGIKKLEFYWDGSGRFFKALKKDNLVVGLPATVLVDRKGMALGVLNGPAAWNDKDALNLIRKTLMLNGQE